MTSQLESTYEPDTLRKPWPSLLWIVVAAIMAVTTLALAPVPL